MALVSVSDLSTYMDVKFSLRQQDAADFVLEGLQSELEAYLRRPVEQEAFVEHHTLDSNHIGVPMDSFFYNTSLDTTMQHIGFTMPPSTVYLANTPIASVTQVRLKPNLQNDYTVLTNERDYTVRRYGIDLYRGFANDIVEITYNGGLDGANIKVFKLMILRAATREMQNMHDDVVGVKDLEPRNVAPMETGFLDKELLAVKRYRRVRVA
jgi:hypothetical protein